MKTIVAAVAVLGVTAASARGDFTNRVLLASYPGNVPGFTNSQHFLATNGPETLDVSVDYAVFLPSQFPGNFIPFSGFPALAPNDYVYAYQVYNNGPGHGASNAAFSQLGINSAGGTIDSLGKDPTFDPNASAINTNFGFLSPTGASYLFLVPAIAVNQFSVVLLLASPQPPTLSAAAIFDHGLSASGQVPMPVPEPGTLALLAIGAVLARKLRRGA